MSIFGRIKNAIFGQAHAATPAPKAAQPAAPQTAQAPASAVPSSPAAANTTASGSASANSTAASQAKPAATAASPVTPASSGTGPSGTAASQHVDVEQVLNAAVSKSGQKLDWRHSIVDLMKALGMDASLEERKELAAELNYTGDMHDSAKMNMFLHKALMKALSENGGKVPAELLD